jgi:hypothetical protein
MAEALQSIEKIEISSISSVTLKNNEGTSAIATELGIRESSLKALSNLGTLREGDTFTLTRNSDGNGVMKKIRNNIARGERKINESYPLPKEAIYQDLEK